jgi:hypothetical protein
MVWPEGLTHPVGGVATELVDDVLIAGEHPGLGPAHDVHDGAGVDALNQQQRRCGVPGVVQPGIANASLSEQRLSARPVRSRVDRATGRLAEHQPVLFPHCAGT